MIKKHRPTFVSLLLSLTLSSCASLTWIELDDPSTDIIGKSVIVDKSCGVRPIFARNLISAKTDASIGISSELVSEKRKAEQSISTSFTKAIRASIENSSEYSVITNIKNVKIVSLSNFEKFTSQKFVYQAMMADEVEVEITKLSSSNIESSADITQLSEQLAGAINNRPAAMSVHV